MSKHASNPLKYGCVIGNKKLIALGWCMHQLNELLKINVKINLAVDDLKQIQD